jgi:ribosomal protein L35AE/L33A
MSKMGNAATYMQDHPGKYITGDQLGRIHGRRGFV